MNREGCHITITPHVTFTAKCSCGAEVVQSKDSAETGPHGPIKRRLT